jgi:hypothetical protein
MQSEWKEVGTKLSSGNRENVFSDTIAYSAIGRAHPSTREARGTGGGRSSSRGTPTTPLHTAPKFLPEKGREAGST